jgi:hypothetical protein
VSLWTNRLRIDPVPILLTVGDPALEHHVRRDLLGENVGPVVSLWGLPLPQKLLRKQQSDGSWPSRSSSRHKYPEINYNLVETFRNLRVLIDQYGFNSLHPGLALAAEYVFSCQTQEGDIRGILGTQYMPYYHGALCELLIKAGYVDDPRVDVALEWLLSVRQDDGGWLIPLQAIPARKKTPDIWSAEPVPFAPSLPHSHLATGMALRALARHPHHRTSPEALAAGTALKSRFFKPDKYRDRKASSYWTKFQYPFWWPNILTALDTLAHLGFPADDPQVQLGLDWFIAHQGDDGLWATSYEQARRKELSCKEIDAQRWVTLATARVFARFCP